MKFLFVVKQKKNVETFAATIRALLERGHAVTLTVQEGHELREDWIGDHASPRFSVVRGPALRTDAWAAVAPLLRSLHDCTHYLQPALRTARKLQQRSVKKLGEDLEVAGVEEQTAEVFLVIPPSQVQRIDAILDLAEQALPVDPLWTSFIAGQAPDAVLVSPLVHFGSAQADVVAAARAVGVPVGMLLFSWDNLSTKGQLHLHPERMFVWNELQRSEAASLHRFPADRVEVVGAPRFDAFFEKRPQLTRDSFHGPLGLDAGKPTLLYVCSSAFVSSFERAFVQRWIEAIRRDGSHALRHCNIVVRPHPDIDLLSDLEPQSEVRWPSPSSLKGIASRPFGDDRAIVLRTSYRSMQGLYESIAHSAAVVGLNTSAELEAAIAGRPVYTVLADERDADGQGGTLHFHYLLESQGGFVKVAPNLSEHIAMLGAEIEAPTDPSRLRRFVSEFLRPMGIDRPVAPLLADAIERAFAPRTGASRGRTAPVARHDIESQGAIEPRVLPLTGKFTELRLHVPPDPDGPGRDRFKADPTTVEWLQEHVAIGDVLYDFGAGIGTYTVIAARHRGSIVVAFEPGYAAFKLLCDNLRLNGCAGSVIPFSLALGNSEGMAELKYGPDRPGGHYHVVRRAPWRVKRGADDGRAFTQPVAMTTLDAAVARYELPLPNHLRFSEDTAAATVLAGATNVLASEHLRSVFVTVQQEECTVLARTLASLQWVVGLRKDISRGRSHLLMLAPRAMVRTP